MKKIQTNISAYNVSFFKEDSSRKFFFIKIKNEEGEGEDKKSIQETFILPNDGIAYIDISDSSIRIVFKDEIKFKNNIFIFGEPSIIKSKYRELKESLNLIEYCFK